MIGIGVAFLVLLALAAAGGTAKAATGTPSDLANGMFGGQKIPVDVQKQIAQALTALTVGTDGKIVGPVTADAIAAASAIAAAIDAAGYHQAAAALQNYIKAARTLLAPGATIPLPSSIPADLQAKINQAIQTERDPKKLQAIVNALKKLPSSTDVTNAIAMLEALIVQVQTAATQAATLAAIQKQIGTPAAPTTGPQVQVPNPAPQIARTYQTQVGDTGSSIAAAFTGNANRWPELRDANPGTASAQYGMAFNAGVAVLKLPASWPAHTMTTGTPAPAPRTTMPVSRPATGGMLRQGSTGPAVAAWQKKIGVTQDGIFGPQTTAATKAWQAAHGLTADGIVGPQTLAAATQVPSATPGPFVPPPPAPPPTVSPVYASHAMIRQGSTGPDVVAWQNVLGVTADGQFGPATNAATVAWQSAHGLSADGVVGPNTWAAAQGLGLVSGLPEYPSHVPPFAIAGDVPEPKTPLEMAAEAMCRNLKAVQTLHGMPGARGKEDKTLVRKFQQIAAGKHDGLASVGTMILAARAGQGDLPLVMYWPKNATAQNVVEYQNLLRHIAEEADKSGNHAYAAALQASAIRERGQGAKRAITPDIENNASV